MFCVVGFGGIWIGLGTGCGDGAFCGCKSNHSPPHTPKQTTKQDAELTAAGRAQCLRLHRRLLRSRLMETLDLVVVSPLRRTLATASLAFGEGEGEAGEGNGADHGKNGRFLRPHVPPLVAVEAIRETTGACGGWWMGGWA